MPLEASGLFPAYELAVRSQLRQLATSRPMGVIQYGSFVRSVNGVAMATFDDMTVPLAAQSPFWAAGKLESRHVEVWRRRQIVALSAAKVCCTTTQWVKDSMINDLGIDPDKIHVVGVGNNSESIIEPGRIRDWDHPNFLFVGRDWQRKNGAAVLAAFAHVHGQHPDARLTIVGCSPNLGAIDGVTVVGPLSHEDPTEASVFRELYAKATCFVLPSHFEPSAVSYVEAMASGMPVIGTTIGGSAELIGDAGIVVRPDSQTDLTRAMLYLANGRNARSFETVALDRSSRYSWRLVVSRIIQLLDGDPI